ncbi:hypothetical protein SAZ11_25375 [Streptomyces sp. FXJ1.4098]|nr:hypothetical protein [Streptomyces sp. FXJ1.4098]
MEDEGAAGQPGQYQDDADEAEERGHQADDQQAAQEVGQIQQKTADGGVVGAPLALGDVDAALLEPQLMGVWGGPGRR